MCACACACPCACPCACACACICVYVQSIIQTFCCCYRIQYQAHASALVLYLCSHDREQNCFLKAVSLHRQRPLMKHRFPYSTSTIGNCHYVNVETVKYQDQNSIVFGDNINGEPNPIKVDVNVWEVRDQCTLSVSDRA